MEEAVAMDAVLPEVRTALKESLFLLTSFPRK